MKNKLTELKQYITQFKKAGIAFSGGIDSAFLLKVAYSVLKENVTAFIVKSQFIKDDQINDAIQFCDELGVNYLLINHNIFNHAKVLTNPPDRCYHCKKVIIQSIKQEMKRVKLDVLFDGTNLDDSGAYRPGKKAIDEEGILSPLLVNGFSKKDIRDTAKEISIPFWDKPSDTCLATRIPYNKMITEQKLIQIDLAEKYLKEEGFKIYRVRHHGEIARIEIGVDELPLLLNNLPAFNRIKKKMKMTGFQFCTLDMDGYQSGTYDKDKNKLTAEDAEF